MSTDSKEIPRQPLIFATSPAFDFTKIPPEYGDMALREGEFYGTLLFDYRGDSGKSVTFEIYFSDELQKWSRVDCSDFFWNKHKSVHKKIPDNATQNRLLRALFNFLAEWTYGKFILPTAKQTTQLPQFEHYSYKLPYAAQIGDAQGTKTLLAAKADPNIEHLFTPLQAAVMPPFKWSLASARDAVIKELLTAKANPNLTGSSELHSPLELSARTGCITWITQLLKAKADPQKPKVLQELAKQSPLSSDRYAAIKLVLEAKADPNVVQALEPRSALIIILEQIATTHYILDSETQTVELLVKGKAIVPEKSSNGESLSKAVGRSSQITALLLEAKATQLVHSTLSMAIFKEDPKTVQTLIEGRTELNPRNEMPPLMGAIQRHYSDSGKQFEIFKLLLDNKADPRYTWRPQSGDAIQQVMYPLYSHNAESLFRAKVSLSLEESRRYCQKALKENNFMGLETLLKFQTDLIPSLSAMLSNALLDPNYCPRYGNIIEILARHKADFSSTGFNDETLLHRIVRLNLGPKYCFAMYKEVDSRKYYPLFITRLLELKAKITRNSDHLTPFQLAQAMPLDDVSKELSKLLYQAEIHQSKIVSFLSMFHPRAGKESAGATLKSRSHFEPQTMDIVLKSAGIKRSY